MVQRKPNDIEVTAVQRLHEGAPRSLDAVGPCLVKWLSRGHVAFDDVIGKVVESDLRSFVENGGSEMSTFYAAQQNDTFVKCNKTFNAVIYDYVLLQLRRWGDEFFGMFYSLWGFSVICDWEQFMFGCNFCLELF